MSASCEEKNLESNKRKASHDESGDAAENIKQAKTDVTSTGTHLGWDSLEPFSLVKVLKDDPQTKLVVVHAKTKKKKGGQNTDDGRDEEIQSGESEDAIIVMEKTPFNTTEASVKQMLNGTEIAQVFNNDIYGTYNAHPPKSHNSK